MERPSPTANRPFYEKAWAAARTLNPDRLARATKPAQFETAGDAHTLTDGKRSIQIPPAVPSPFAVNLLENIQRLTLDVEQVAALHGPRVATLAVLAASVRPAVTPSR